MDKNRTQNTKSSRYPDGFRIMMGTQEYVSYREHSSVRVWPYDQGYACPGHQHSAVEIALCIEGDIEFTLPDSVYHVTAGQVFIIPPRVGHAIRNDEGTNRYLILFEPDILSGLRDLQLIEDRLQEPILFANDTPEGAEAYDILLKLVECYDQAKPLWNMQCYAYLLQFYTIVGQSMLPHERSHSIIADYKTDAELMNSVMAYIEENITGTLSLEKVAEFAGFSKFYFSRIFNAYVGMSFTEFLNRRRLTHADHLLISTCEPVNEIAKRAGFGSVATFSRVFMNVHNCTPSQFRALYGET